jgi:UDP-N-acetylmuramate--alanine ligase
MFSLVKKIHFVGIGGSGMNGIAEVLHNLDYKISGSDAKDSSILERFRNFGIEIFVGHDEKNISDDVEVVVISSAISQENPEVVYAKSKKIPVIPRAEMLAELMRLKYSILVAGTHGKTTTTSIISWLMHKLNLDPTIVIGGKLNDIGTGAKLGQGKFFVAEADESDGSFLKYNPIVAVLTNIDSDHLDYYGDMENLKKAFLSFIDKVPFYGFSVLCNDNEIVRDLVMKTNRKCLTYGIDTESDLMAKNILIKDGFNTFDVYKKGENIGKIQLPIPGKHNVLNTLAGISVLLELDIKFEDIADKIKEFKGVGRRLEIKGKKNDVLVIDDYGHHPTEMHASWSAVSDFWKDYKKYVIFQPHRYSRTKILAKEFAEVLAKMDNVLLLPIYPAGEKNVFNLDINSILQFVPEKDMSKIIYFENKDDLSNYLDKNINEKSLIMTLGAGDVYKIGEEYLKR